MGTKPLESLLSISTVGVVILSFLTAILLKKNSSNQDCINKLNKDITEMRSSFDDNINGINDNINLLKNNVNQKLKDNINTVNRELRDNINTVNRELRDNINTVNRELKDDINTVNRELKDNINTVNRELNNDMDELKNYVDQGLNDMDNSIKSCDLYSQEANIKIMSLESRVNQMNNTLNSVRPEITEQNISLAETHFYHDDTTSRNVKFGKSCNIVKSCLGIREANQYLKNERGQNVDVLNFGSDGININSQNSKNSKKSRQRSRSFSYKRKG